MPQVRSEQVLQLGRSGKLRCNCQVLPLMPASSAQLPLAVNVVQLARLENSHEFLRLDRRHVKRIVFELIPDTMADVAGFREFQYYLLRGRDASSRAGVALEMEDRGYKLFILPPGQAAMSLGYHGDLMIAVLRSRW